jgi:cytochrome c biogenesis protein
MQRRSLAHRLYELLSSMRFAISLLTVLAIASVVGTVLQQNEPFNAYLNQFGPFWFAVFESLDLYGVYNAGWFLVILAFLVTSTTACILRQTAPMIREMRRFGEQARKASLASFAHVHRTSSPLPLTVLKPRLLAWLRVHGYQVRENTREDGFLLAAKKGSHNRLGYFLAHGAIVLICIGGLIDGNLPLKIQMFLGEKKISAPNRLIADIGPESRLGMDNPSYRGNLFIPEGQSASLAVVGIGDGILLQPIPFSVSLKAFHIDHYQNGMPKRFASDIILHDPDTGESVEHTIEVNHPLTYRGITLYQASFDDGGSTLQLRARSLTDNAQPFDFEMAVGEARGLNHPDYRYTLELSDFQPFNVEAMAQEPAVRPSVFTGFDRHLGSAAKPTHESEMRNLGPRYEYKLRDEAGQAVEFRNYMSPIEQDGRWYLFTGMRKTQADDFSYLRIPLDEEGRPEPWFAAHRLWQNEASRLILASRYARQNADEGSTDPEALQRLAETAYQTMTLFSKGGFEAVSEFITQSIPEAEHTRAAEIFIKILQGSMWETWQFWREQNGHTRLEITEARALYLRDVLAASSDALHYPAPLYLQLNGFELRQATVLQVTRSPGKPIVYLGSLLLVLGVFAMLYIRERRFFVLVEKNGDILVAFSSNRRTYDLDRTFETQIQSLQPLLASPLSDPAPSGMVKS